jgi:hypothetical protein
MVDREESRPQKKKKMSNIYPSKCILCNEVVLFDQGEVVGRDSQSEKWRVKHLEGHCVVKKTIEAVKKTIDLHPPLTNDEFEEIPLGYYSVTVKSAPALWHVKFDTSKDRCRLRPVSSLTSTPPPPPVSNELSRQILGEIRKNPLAAHERYGRETGRCYKCNYPLVDEESKQLGIGPTCRIQFRNKREDSSSSDSEESEDNNNEESTSLDNFIVNDSSNSNSNPGL